MGDGTAAAGDAPRGEVTVDDASFFTARFADGVLGTFEATRMALGRRNAFRIEINGTRGSLAFDFEKNNELEFFDGTEPRPQQGFRRILVTEPEHPYIAAWWPPGHGLGYEHGFTNQVADLVSAIAANRQPLPSFDDGRQVQRVLGAAQQSADNDSAWTTV
jgi:predicted dehydrogenase